MKGRGKNDRIRIFERLTEDYKTQIIGKAGLIACTVRKCPIRLRILRAAQRPACM
jgi:hypothetical protein